MKRKLNFTKMHGIGNDYIYINGLVEKLPNPEKLAIKLSDRHFSIGGDGIILINPSDTADFEMRMFNADGSEGKMCGNGVRCVAKFVYDKGLTDKKSIKLKTASGVKILELTTDGQNKVSSVKVDMGEPILEPARIPVKYGSDPVVNQVLFPEIYAQPVTCVSMGNPHAIFFVEQINTELVHGTGPQIENHPIFPERTNVEFVQVINRSELNMRVWERGSAETLACGTGACAVVVASVLANLTDRKVCVHLLGGDLQIEWHENNHVFMQGPAEISFEGTVEVDD